MQMVNMHEAKTHLSKLVDAALRGEEIAIARRNKPLVKLQVLEEDDGEGSIIGRLPNLIIKMDDNFNDSFDDWDDGWPTPAKGED
jgi:prevent-host-death family protein